MREGICQDCGREYVGWFTDNETWNLVTKEELHFLCASCFLVRTGDTSFYITNKTDQQEEFAEAISYIRELEALILEAEWYGDAGFQEGPSACLWCNATKWSEKDEIHEEDCPIHIIRSSNEVIKHIGCE